MGKFQVGDVVEVIKNYPGRECDPEDINRVGAVYTIIAQAYMYNNYSGRKAWVNIVDEAPGPHAIPGSVVGFEDEYLRKVDDGDCYEKTEWDETIFKPRILERVE